MFSIMLSSDVIGVSAVVLSTRFIDSPLLKAALALLPFTIAQISVSPTKFQTRWCKGLGATKNDYRKVCRSYIYNLWQFIKSRVLF